MTFFYLDRSGIWSLFEQTINDVEKEFDRLYKTNPTGGLEEKNTLARRLSELLPRQQRRSHTNPKRERGSDEIK